MEIKPDEKVEYMCNFEVMKYLQAIRDAKQRWNEQTNEPLATLTYETLAYLEASPCGTQTPNGIKKTIKALSRYKLTPLEMLTIINLMPTKPEEIQIIVDDNETIDKYNPSENGRVRLTDEQVNEILSMVKVHFYNENADC